MASWLFHGLRPRPDWRRVALMCKPHIFQKAPIVQTASPGTHWFCTCGRSLTQPLCDGAHKGTGLGPLKVEIAEEKQVAWCGCKHSQALPFCDGAHRSLP